MAYGHGVGLDRRQPVKSSGGSSRRSVDSRGNAREKSRRLAE